MGDDLVGLGREGDLGIQFVKFGSRPKTFHVLAAFPRRIYDGVESSLTFEYLHSGSSDSAYSQIEEWVDAAREAEVVVNDCRTRKPKSSRLSWEPNTPRQSQVVPPFPRWQALSLVVMHHFVIASYVVAIATVAIFGDSNKQASLELIG